MTDIPVPRGFSYEQNLPYDMPPALDALHGPTTGTITAPPHIDSAPNPVYDLADVSQLRSLYSRVVRDGTPEDQMRLLDASLLRALWPELVLPTRCRTQWEERFVGLLAEVPGAIA